MKRLHDLYTILTLIEHDMSTQLNSSLHNLIPRVFVPYHTCWLSGRKILSKNKPVQKLIAKYVFDCYEKRRSLVLKVNIDYSSTSVNLC